MNEHFVTAKAAVAAFFAALGAFLGWRIIILLVWVALMILDYISGSLAARQRGIWKSQTAREGIGHKVGMVLVVVVCMTADFIMLLICENLPRDILAIQWPMVISPMVTMWYIITEIGSIIENAMEMGAPIPGWLPKLLNATLKAVDNAADPASPLDETKI